MSLALPLFVTQASSCLNCSISLMFCGRLDKIHFDGAILANVLINALGLSLAIGLSTSCDTLFSQVYGSANKHKLGLAFFIHVPLSKYLESQGIIRPSMIIGLLSNVINVVIHLILVTKMEYGLDGSSIAQASAHVAFLSLTVVYIILFKVYKLTWTGWSTECLLDWSQMLWLGWFGLIMTCIAWWSYEAGQILSGFEESGHSYRDNPGYGESSDNLDLCPDGDHNFSHVSDTNYRDPGKGLELWDTRQSIYRSYSSNYRPGTIISQMCSGVCGIVFPDGYWTELKKMMYFSLSLERCYCVELRLSQEICYCVELRLSQESCYCVELRLSQERCYCVELRLSQERCYCVELRLSQERCYCVELRLSQERCYCVELRLSQERCYCVELRLSQERMFTVVTGEMLLCRVTVVTGEMLLCRVTVVTGEMLLCRALDRVNIATEEEPPSDRTLLDK
ncbi:hypothetical protein LSH36_922g02024 [Paralvinella palmiformis]|uniref:Uncharacterized protein n=1 Tax=Paralvinella palmiformis TaxID=53620 RepID=A0AAD9IYM5_9ANNE|nr:hypothetical protein LSH36_922g02024 [Paralvinella palmiformis]